jgi:hypothetical protein
VGPWESYAVRSVRGGWRRTAPVLCLLAAAWRSLIHKWMLNSPLLILRDSGLLLMATVGQHDLTALSGLEVMAAAQLYSRSVCAAPCC